MGEELNPYSPYWLYNNLMFLFPRVNYNPDDYYKRQLELQRRQAMTTGLSNFGATLGNFIGQKTGLNTGNSGGSSDGGSDGNEPVDKPYINSGYRKFKDFSQLKDENGKRLSRSELKEKYKGAAFKERMQYRAGEAGLYMSMAGQLGEAVFGSNDYSGEKGNITSGMDAGYDAAKQVASQLGPWGKMAAGIMDINAGLGNAFGLTDKTNKIDAAFDSKMTPFFLKWINSSGAKTVRSGLSAQEDDRLQAFNQDAYGDTGFDMIGKKVGRFAKKYYNRFLNKVNKYTNSMLAMANQAELQGIRSQGMASENALNYYQEISGGMDLVERGSKGMKITKSLIERFRNVRGTLKYKKGGKNEEDNSLLIETKQHISEEDFINEKIKLRIEQAVLKATTRKLPYMFKNKDWKNCIATALDNFGVPICLRNSEFAENPEKYGFKEIFFGDNTDTLPDGTLLLDYNRPNNSSVPGHMIMLVGRDEKGAPIYSYSRGDNDTSSMINLTRDYYFRWNDKVKPRAYTFVGTSDDIRKWKEEYKALYPEKIPLFPFENSTPVFKKGGHLSRQMNVIPEGALHAHKNHMEGAGEDFTSKGIPVVTNDKEAKQTAEIEREEIIFTKNVTDKIEKWYKEFYDENTSSSDKDELAIKCGKFLVNEILFNTDDRVGLIRKIEEKDGN